MDWLRHKWAWANRNPLFWANLLLVAFSGLLIFVLPGPSDLRLRMWGMMLQLLGVVTVWLDLTGTARKFGKGGLVRRTLAWLREFAEGSKVIALGGVAAVFAGMKGRAKVRRPIKADAPLPDRVATLETNVELLDKDLDAAYQEIGNRANELDAKIKAESEKHDQAIREVKTSLEDAAVGNFATLAFGAAWLAIGIVLATLASDIVKLAAGQWCEVWQAL
jgi:hypothetical protein